MALYIGELWSTVSFLKSVESFPKRNKKKERKKNTQGERLYLHRFIALAIFKTEKDGQK